MMSRSLQSGVEVPLRGKDKCKVTGWVRKSEKGENFFSRGRSRVMPGITVDCVEYNIFNKVL